MDIIDDIFGSVQKAGKFVADKAIDTKEFVKLEYKISGVRNEIASKLTGLGKITYKEAVMGETNEQLKAQYISEIKELTAALAELNLQMEKFKKICKSCGKTASKDANFCKDCGTEL